MAKAFGHIGTQYHFTQGFRLGEGVCKSPPLSPLQTLALAFEAGEDFRRTAQHGVPHIAVAKLYGNRPLHLGQLRQGGVALVAHVARRASNLEDAVEHEFGGAATRPHDQVHAAQGIGETAFGVLAQLLYAQQDQHRHADRHHHHGQRLLARPRTAPSQVQPHHARLLKGMANIWSKR